MARPVIEGLEYANIDVNIFDDIKILFVSDRFAEKGELFSIKLLLWIYKQGYYTQWNDEIAMLFSKKNFKNVSFDLANDIVRELLKRGFFDEAIFQKFGILTSKGIQKRWIKVVTVAKRKCAICDEYNLLLPGIKEETPAKPESIPPEPAQTPSEGTVITQSKVEESKGKESKEYTPAPVVPIDIVFPIEQCLTISLNDPRWVNANKTSKKELEEFNSMLEKRAIYDKNPADYKNHFANWKLSGKKEIGTVIQTTTKMVM
jgi:hypothetical protein